MRLVRVTMTIIAIAIIAFFGYTNFKYFSKIDLLSPIIDMNSSEITVSINDPITQVMDGVTATDSKDGDVTNKIVIKGVSNFTEKDKRDVDFIAFDNDGNYSEAQRTLIYSDYESPKFEIKGALKFPIGTTDKDILSKVSVWDCLDGDISNKITFSSQSVVNSSVPAKYKVDLCIENSAGDSVILPVTIEIYNSMVSSIAPTINLNKYLVYTDMGIKINPLDYIENIEYRGQTYGLTEGEGTFGIDTSDWDSYAKKEFAQRDPEVNVDKIEISNYINYQIPGVYEIVYDLEDMEENVGSVTLTVVVQDYE